MTGQHLTDEQFTELLSGGCPLDASRHMLSCAQCQSELKRVQASLQDFAFLSLEWAEHRASASIPTPSALVRRWQAASTWTAAAAAVVAAAILFGVHQENRMQTPDVSITVSQPPQSASEIADDNRLMMAIDKEIRWQAESPISVDDLATASTRPHSQSSRRLTN
jgi:ferric-dicitrate binding protein FerR (iron transport regulator)